MRTAIRITLIVFSVLAGILDAMNVNYAYTQGKSLESDGIHYLTLSAVAVMVAFFSWLSPIEFGFARNDRKPGMAVMWMALTILATVYNMACSKAYLTRTFPFVRDVTGPVALTIPFTNATVYTTDDWFRDLSSYMPCIILFSMVVVNIEGKRKLSPAEERQEVLDQIERAQIDKMRREVLNPLQAQGVEAGAAALKGKGAAFLRGMGVPVPKKFVAVEEPAATEEADEDMPPAERTIAVVTDKDLTTKDLAAIFKKTPKTIGNRIRAGAIPAQSTEVGSTGRTRWIADRDEIHERFPIEFERWEKAKQRNVSRRKSPPRQDNEPTQLFG